MIRRRVYSLLGPAAPGDAASRTIDVLLIVLILASVLGIVLESVAAIRDAVGPQLKVAEVVVVGLFSVEYVLRLWSCTSDPGYCRPVTGRIRYALRPDLLIDLVAVLPFYLPIVGIDLRVLRLLRAVRLLRVLKLGRYSTTLRLIATVLKKRQEEMIVSVGLVLVLLLIASTLMYYAESEAQPDKFGSIPAAMWWAVVTLTTIGYGDVYPVTVAGKLVASIMSVLAIGLVALPTGILGASFVEEFQNIRARRPTSETGDAGSYDDTLSRD